jgi:hypothetical protein
LTLTYYATSTCTVPATAAFLVYSGYCSADKDAATYQSSLTNCKTLSITYYANSNCTGAALSYNFVPYQCFKVGVSTWLSIINCPGTTVPPTNTPAAMNAYQSFKAVVFTSSSDTCSSNPNANTNYFMGVISYCLYTGVSALPAMQIIPTLSSSTTTGAIVYTASFFTDDACAYSAGASLVITSGTCFNYQSSTSGQTYPIYIYILPKLASYSWTWSLTTDTYLYDAVTETNVENSVCLHSYLSVSTADPFGSIRAQTARVLCFDDGSYLLWAYPSQSCFGFSTTGLEIYYMQLGITSYVQSDQTLMMTSVSCSNSFATNTISPYMYEFLLYRPTRTCNDVTSSNVQWETIGLYKNIGVSNQCNANVGDGLTFNSIYVTCNYAASSYTLNVYSDSSCSHLLTQVSGSSAITSDSNAEYSNYANTAICNTFTANAFTFSFQMYCQVQQPVLPTLSSVYTYTVNASSTCNDDDVASNNGNSGLCHSVTGFSSSSSFASMMVYCINAVDYTAAFYSTSDCSGVSVVNLVGSSSTCIVKSGIALYIVCTTQSSSESLWNVIIDTLFRGEAVQVWMIIAYVGIGICGLCILLCLWPQISDCYKQLCGNNKDYSPLQKS